MNCNQVFNILTRGPFPTGEPTDASVEIHLATCASCRRLAEALRPALEVFQEAVGPDECGSLPGYWGELAPTVAESNVTTALMRAKTQLQRNLGSEKLSFKEHLQIWRVRIGLFVMGMLLGALAAGLFEGVARVRLAADHSQPVMQSAPAPSGVTSAERP